MQRDHLVRALVLGHEYAHSSVILDELHFRTNLPANSPVVGAKRLAHRMHGLLFLDEFLLQHVIAIQHLLLRPQVLLHLLRILYRFVGVYQEMYVPFSRRIKGLDITENLSLNSLKAL